MVLRLGVGSMLKCPTVEHKMNCKHLLKATACPCPFQITEWPVVGFQVGRNLACSARKLGL